MVQEVTPEALVAGEQAVVRVTVTNVGAAEARDVAVTDVLDPALVPAGDLPQGCGRAARTGAVVCGGPGTALAPGQSLGYAIPVRVDPALQDGAEVIARAAATAAGVPGDTTLLTAPARAYADVELVMAAPPAVNAGDVIGYRLTVTNHGPSRAEGVTLRSRNRGGGATVTDRPAAECPGTGVTVACALGDLAPGEVRTLALAIAPGPAAPFENCAVVRLAGQDRDPADNRSCASTRVEPAPAPAEIPPPPPPEQAAGPPDAIVDMPMEAPHDEPGQPAAGPPDRDGAVRPAAAGDGARRTGDGTAVPAAGLPVTGVSLWMLALGVPVLLAVGLLVRHFSRRERAAGRAP
ncbi:DUF11 domain-containing protein [Actinomadura sp. ATCC 31491]|uniref:DUF11 domain-containing protein n=1 Tax=Actinomadura luzonensis TaxID=2805427 RepID=A0ABT0G655_9ACTN|nr:DUF11 domain-containing protein [Actinomadura luzonensis]MCK2220074.1 DUF11 domain-containing protein [Actinomadura luzonensis]